MSLNNRKAPTGVKVERKGNSLIITVADVTQTHGNSESGLSECIATTHGAFKFEGLDVSVNVYKPIPAAREAKRTLEKEIAKRIREEMAAQLKLGNAAIDKANGKGAPVPQSVRA